ncbi:32916_t:CDS:2, partial [Racocetra persica]
QSLIWGAHDISSERSQTQNVINHIEQLLTETEAKKINIKAFVSDSAGNLRDEQMCIYNKYIALIVP